MNSMHDIWGQRFFHYVNELQKYMRYVFTGHLAIVFMFAIGAGGYAYSEWLKEVPQSFPSVWVVAIVLALLLMKAAPTTLLKPADIVYFLPLEDQLPNYMRRSLTWSTFSQLPLPLIAMIVALPLLKATEVGTGIDYLLVILLIVAIKGVYVRTEFNVRIANDEFIWPDRILRLALAFLVIYFGLLWSPAFFFVGVLVAILYAKFWEKKASQFPFPYEQFIELEQNRMMRFYRFANYFTEVPHLVGSVSKRSWLTFAMKRSTFKRRDVQSYLVVRTFIRTDDTFWLWLRLTALSALGAFLIPLPIVSFIFVGVLAFATAVQLILALEGGVEFTMDQLYPEEQEKSQNKAVRSLVRKLIWLQAVILLLAALPLYGLSLIPVLIALIALIIGEATIRLTKEQTKEF
ncbi:ABC transporter permease [Sporosarcina sp. GW1-11]|uniref:ABC transporter permease n=1 Tax=Sporosarcina sp. GW1-11 TaxID=2899126 RepID=UPI00294E4301|nr:ABC transporter permease [Sporosarcina sp. GW1-11]MDV6378400.1 ABC transporter permease [Sporosarcina sp. GW1-11]